MPPFLHKDSIQEGPFNLPCELALTPLSHSCAFPNPVVSGGYVSACILQVETVYSLRGEKTSRILLSSRNTYAPGLDPGKRLSRNSDTVGKLSKRQERVAGKWKPAWEPGRAQSGPAHLLARGQALASYPQLGNQ